MNSCEYVLRLKLGFFSQRPVMYRGIPKVAFELTHVGVALHKISVYQAYFAVYTDLLNVFRKKCFHFVIVELIKNRVSMKSGIRLRYL